MKNDIDSLLNSMFRNGKLNLKSTQPDDDNSKNVAGSTPQLVWDATEKIDKLAGKTSANLQKSIDELTKQTHKDLADLEKNLHNDGLSATATKPAQNDKIVAAFTAAVNEVNTAVIGQEEFVSSLAIAFKRPFVVGANPQMPLARAIITGKNGTGRHTALQKMATSLEKHGALHSGRLSFINLAAYATADADRLLLQDLYSALKSDTCGIVFENFEGCHPSLLPLISQLFTQGTVTLGGRYAEQKGMLVDIGTALVPNAISTLSAAGKYIFLLTDKPTTKLANAFGTPLLNSIDDTVKSNSFTDDALEKIAEAALQRVSSKCVKQLNFTVTYSPEAATTLAAHFNEIDGAEAITAAAENIFKQLSEVKLYHGCPSATVKITAENNTLTATCTLPGESLTLSLAPTAADTANDAVAAVKAQLNDIVGLSSVKDYILSLEDNFKIQQLRRERGLKAESPSMHMIFTGNPGTGKTTVARIVAAYLKAIGVLSGGQLIEVTRADLVGKYVGHTAPLTAKAIQAALGGVLFIDEAYSLYRGKDDTFGLEAIDTLVKGMEDNRSNLLVILAGYSREMEDFLTANSGLRSRFPNIIEFPDYTADELYQITESIAHGKGYRLADECKPLLLAAYDEKQKNGDPHTNGNGRMARNMVEEAIINCSTRNIKLPPEEQNLELLLPEDFEL